MKKDPLDRLAKLYGIAGSYHDFRGELHEVSRASRIAILSGLGVEVSDDQSIDTAIHAFETSRWMRAAPPAVVCTAGEAPRLPIAIPVDLQAAQLRWVLTHEDGSRAEGSAQLKGLEVAERGDLDGRSFIRVLLQLPADLPLGYHRVAVTLDTGLNAQTRLIVTPPHCHQPAIIAEGQRVWGIAVQLYSLRSADNWGVGDFRDLRELITFAAPLGCTLVGLNPLHALMPADPAHISPYSPSSRQFLNVLYISVPDVPEFSECAEARAKVASKEFQTQLQRLRAPANVDYPGVARAKFDMLRLLYEHFRKEHLQTDSPRAVAFRTYVQSRGEPLKLHAIYDALDADFRRQGPQYWGWPSWPEEYSDPTSSAVNRFARERVVEVDYFLWLQWLAEEQLASAQALARTSGMSIGLYGDVAVGANSGGSETWANRHLYLQSASVGAPPDALALKGQDWGIPPQNPFELANQEYEPFIVMVRNNMRSVAALRFDHVMTLFRLWWVPRGMISAHGTYVHYPLRDLIAILALESVRHHCAVIGEDLGTVPDEVRVAMEHYELNHYKVLLFEQEAGLFKAPERYVKNALATVTTHDLPTLRSWWESHDIALRAQLNLYPSEAILKSVQEVRAAELPAMMSALVHEGLWHWQPHDPLPPYSAALARGIHAYLGLSAANFAMLQIEDLIGMIDPVNVPGTDKEHANWQRKVVLNTAEIFARDDVHDLLDAMNRTRRGEHPNAAERQP
ncbi:4-alpha-glucanotransferase [Povalibacter sp.]|uniref:4-alpha-glucanotransferase n=1 Tax=Povalibacter sp. TaxID=1962978 RepID=UPI002F3E3277